MARRAAGGKSVLGASLEGEEDMARVVVMRDIVEESRWRRGVQWR